MDDDSFTLGDAMSVAVGTFIEQCGKMAEENWCPAQVDMLERLFGAVLHGVKYDEWEREDD